MITGYNHNIMHNEKTYHIQTEDSGVKYPHLITHLFVGGNIIGSKKSSYAELLEKGLEEDRFEEELRGLMKVQHKQMLKDLKSGKYDHIGSQKKSRGEALSPEFEKTLEASNASPLVRAVSEPELPSITPLSSDDFKKTMLSTPSFSEFQKAGLSENNLSLDESMEKSERSGKSASSGRARGRSRSRGKRPSFEFRPNEMVRKFTPPTQASFQEDRTSLTPQSSLSGVPPEVSAEHIHVSSKVGSFQPIPIMSASVPVNQKRKSIQREILRYLQKDRTQ